MDAQLNFRGAADYVTDGAGQTYVLQADSYPTSRGGLTFGWLTPPLTASNRDLSLDPRLAGIHGTAAPVDFQLDITAGDYIVHCAIGDASSAQSNVKIVVKDNTSTLLTVGPSNSALGSFYDATGVQRTAANWPTSELGSGILTFATTTCILRLDGNGSDLDVIAHFRLVSATAATGYLLVKN